MRYGHSFDPTHLHFTVCDALVIIPIPGRKSDERPTLAKTSFRFDFQGVIRDLADIGESWAPPASLRALAQVLDPHERAIWDPPDAEASLRAADSKLTEMANAIRGTPLVATAPYVAAHIERLRLQVSAGMGRLDEAADAAARVLGMPVGLGEMELLLMLER